MNDIRQKWEMVKTHDIQGHLQKRTKQRLSAILDRALVDMMRSLTMLFGAVYCTGKTFNGPAISMHHAKALYGIQETVQKELKDCKGFLSVKGERNVTMTTYPLIILVRNRQFVRCCHCGHHNKKMLFRNFFAFNLIFPPNSEETTGVVTVKPQFSVFSFQKHSDDAKGLERAGMTPLYCF